MAGSVFPSRNSRKAPPPVETYEIRSVTSNASMAARVSPPPAIENARGPGNRVRELAGTGRERLELEDPHRAVPHHGTGRFDHLPVRAGGLGADVEDHLARADRVHRPDRGGRGFRGRVRHHHIARDREVAAAPADRIANSGACSTRSASCSDAPTSWPAAAMKVLAIPPPAISRSTRVESASSTPSLVDTFDRRRSPPVGARAARGPCRAPRARRRGAGRRKRSGQSGRRRRSRRGRDARRRRRPSRRRRTAPPSAAPGLRRRLSRPRGSARSRRARSRRGPRRARPASPRPDGPRARAARRAGAHRGKRECGVGPSSFGRPRCDVTITRAPASAACRNDGRAARMRASLATAPSLIGTFRSSRISTRRPARSRSVMARTFILRAADTRRFQAGVRMRMQDDTSFLLEKIMKAYRVGLITGLYLSGGRSSYESPLSPPDVLSVKINSTCVRSTGILLTTTSHIIS